MIIKFMEKEIVPPALYNREYYLNDCDGFREYLENPSAVTHDKFKKLLQYVQIRNGMRILDVGCGRGELVYYFAEKGAYAFGIDYSQDAVNVAKETTSRLPADMQSRIRIEAAIAEDYDFKDQYDYIFMIETTEHMHDWQLRKLFTRFKNILRPEGKIIITTPNLIYEKYFEPLKRILDIPFKFFKLLGRIPRRKYKPASVRQFFKDVLRIKVNRGKVHAMMHCNVNTRGYLKDLLKDFDAEIRCEDHSINPLSLLFQRWCGRYIIAVAGHKNRMKNVS